MRPSLARYITPLPVRLEDHHRLKRLLAGKTLEVDFFKGALQKNKGSAPEERRFWRNGIYDQIREVMPLQGSLSIERMCELARVRRRDWQDDENRTVLGVVQRAGSEFAAANSSLS